MRSNNDHTYCGPTQYSVLLNEIKCECFYYCICSIFPFSFRFCCWFHWMFLFRGLKNCKLTVNMAKYQNDGNSDNNSNHFIHYVEGEWGVNGIVQKSLINWRNSCWKLQRQKLHSRAEALIAPFFPSFWHSHWRLNGILLSIAPIWIWKKKSLFGLQNVWIAIY